MRDFLEILKATRIHNSFFRLKIEPVEPFDRLKNSIRESSSSGDKSGLKRQLWEDLDRYH